MEEKTDMMPDISDWALIMGGAFFHPLLPITILWYAVRRIPGVREWFVEKAKELREGQFFVRVLPAPGNTQNEGKQRNETRSTTPRAERNKPVQGNGATVARPLLPESVGGQRTHLYLTGPVGSGKTTVLHALARSWGKQGAGEIVVVLDPHAVAGGSYPGYRVVGAGGDEQVWRSLNILQEELERRRQKRARGIVSPRMRFLVDDASSIAKQDPQMWLVVMSELAQHGHRLGVYGVWASRSREAMGSDIPSILTLRLFLTESGGRLLRFGEQEYLLPALPDPDTTVQTA